MDTIASDIMSTEVLTARIDTTLEDALKILINHRITGMPVIDDEGKMVGVISESDIIAQLASETLLRPTDFHKQVRFNKKFTAIRETTPIDEVIQLFIKHAKRRLLVVDAGMRPIGVISKRDLMRVFYYRARLT